MSTSDFDFEGNTEDGAPDASPLPAQFSVDSLEQWLEDNYHLWELGLRLASMAQQYRHEYAYVPFNKNGWFSPN